MIQAVVDFLEQHVAGLPLRTREIVYKLDHGKLEGVYADQITFCNLRHNKYALQLDMFVIANEQVYELDGQGRRGKLRRDFSGPSLFRFELARRKSRDELTGLFRMVSAAQSDVPAEAVVGAISRVRLHNESLSLWEDQALYRDMPARDGAYRPVAFEAAHELRLEEGKLRYEYKGECLDVNLADMSRVAGSSTYPSFIAWQD